MYRVRIKVQIVVDKNHYNRLDCAVVWTVPVLCAWLDHAENLRIGSNRPIKVVYSLDDEGESLCSSAEF
jgi:hypothetical protein